MSTTDHIKSVLVGMILQARHRTKEPYRLRRLSRSSASAGPTEEQSKNEVFPAAVPAKLITRFFPVPGGRRRFRGKTKVYPGLAFGKTGL
jgi:hypothetical protein